MEIANTVDAFEALIKEMGKGDQIQNLHHFATAKILLEFLKQEAKKTPHSDANMYIIETYMHLEALAGLINHSAEKEQHVLWLIQSISKLRSPLGFDLK